MQKHLATDFTANYLQTNMADNDKGKDVLAGKLHEKVIDMEWVTAIEDTLPYIEKAIDEQRRFIIENNEVYRIDKAKIINKDSVKHLIQHTNFIDNIDDKGKVTPNKVLTIEREDSFETYENRFLITLIGGNGARPGAQQPAHHLQDGVFQRGEGRAGIAARRQRL